MVRFDGYTATTSAAKVDALVPLLARDGDEITQGRGYHTFEYRIAVKGSSGDEVGSVSWGGRTQGQRVMIEVKGERSPEVVERLRSDFEHKCTRVDSCFDLERPGAWDGLLSTVLAVKEQHRLYGERRGDWDYPEKGRTQYLGADTSPVRARLYEKGKQPEFLHLGRFDFCRLEIQVRPKKEAKTEYSKLSAMEVWGASKWTRQLAAEVLQQHLTAHPPGTIRKETARDRALRWMAGQYGAHLVSLKTDLGSWESLGVNLGEMVREEQLRAKRGLG